MSSLHPIRESLTGKKAFYNAPDYIESTLRDFSSEKALRVSYEWHTEKKSWSLPRLIGSLASPPGKIFHQLAGKIIVSAASSSSSSSFEHMNTKTLVELRKETPLQGEWKYKRLTIAVNGYKIDTVIFGKPSTLANKTWTIALNGNAGFYEDSLGDPENERLKLLLSKIKSNGLVWNYPGVGASSGTPDRKALALALQAQFSFLKHELGAKRIVVTAHCFGGGVLSDALASYTLDPHIRYVFVENHTFSTLAAAASSIFRSFLSGSLAKGFTKASGWNMKPIETSKKLDAPEIILQTCNTGKTRRCREILPPKKRSRSKKPTLTVNDIVNDDILSPDACLAKALLLDENCPTKNKLFLGIPERHNESLGEDTINSLACAIFKFLKGK